MPARSFAGVGVRHLPDIDDCRVRASVISDLEIAAVQRPSTILVDKRLHAPEQGHERLNRSGVSRKMSEHVPGQQPLLPGPTLGNPPPAPVARTIAGIPATPIPSAASDCTNDRRDTC